MKAARRRISGEGELVYEWKRFPGLNNGRLDPGLGGDDVDARSTAGEADAELFLVRVEQRFDSFPHFIRDFWRAVVVLNRRVTFRKDAELSLAPGE